MSTVKRELVPIIIMKEIIDQKRENPNQSVSPSAYPERPKPLGPDESDKIVVPDNTPYLNKSFPIQPPRDVSNFGKYNSPSELNIYQPTYLEHQCPNESYNKILELYIESTGLQAYFDGAWRLISTTYGFEHDSMVNCSYERYFVDEYHHWDVTGYPSGVLVASKEGDLSGTGATYNFSVFGIFHNLRFRDTLHHGALLFWQWTLEMLGDDSWAF